MIHRSLTQVQDTTKATRTQYEGFMQVVTMSQDKRQYRVIYKGKTSAVESFIANMDINKALHYYKTPNSLKSPYNKRQDNLLGLKQITLDIDIHLQDQDKINAIKDVLVYSLTHEQPNIIYSHIRDSGRGLHIVIELEQVSFKLRWLYDKVARALAEQYNQVLNDIRHNYNIIEPLAVDTTTLNPTQLIRVEGSYNPHSNSLVKRVVDNKEIYTLNNLKDILGVDTRKTKRKFTYKGNLSKDLARNRVNIIYSLDKEAQGQRNKRLYLLYNHLVVLYDQATAERLVKDYNNSLYKPLKDVEVEGIIRSVNTRGTYYFKQVTFYEWLGIEAEPTEALVRVQKRLKKQQRNNEILNLLKTTTLTHEAIAERYNVSRHTVLRLAKANNINHKARKQLVELFNGSGAVVKTMVDILDKIKSSKIAVDKLVDMYKYLNLKAQLHKQPRIQAVFTTSYKDKPIYKERFT